MNQHAAPALSSRGPAVLELAAPHPAAPALVSLFPSAQLQHFTPRQHDILYALAGCEDVMFLIKPVTPEVGNEKE